MSRVTDKTCGAAHLPVDPIRDPRARTAHRRLDRDVLLRILEALLYRSALATDIQQQCTVFATVAEAVSYSLLHDHVSALAIRQATVGAGVMLR